MSLHDSLNPARVVFLVLLLAIGARSVEAQASMDFLPVNPDPQSYVAGPMPRHCLQTFRLFLPPAPWVQPAEGWPVVLDVRLNGFARSEDTPFLSLDSLQGKLLDQGIAVVTARVTPSIPTTDESYINWCGSAPDIPGHGLFHPPGYVPPDLAAQGISPYEQPEYHMAEKDCVMLIQHVRYKARQTSNFKTHLDMAMSQLDHRRIAAYGSSASAIALMWATLGSERNDELPFAGLPGQYAESSRPDLAVLDQGVVWWPAFIGKLQFPVSHFGNDGHSENPATYVRDVDPLELAQASAFLYEDKGAIRQLPLYLSYGEVSQSTQYDKSAAGCNGLPLCFPGQGLEGLGGPSGDTKMFHPAWSGYAWHNEHTTEPIRLVITDEAAFAQAGNVPAVPLFGDPSTQTPDEIEALLHDDVINWLLAEFEALRLGYPADQWWSLGNGLAGEQGVPRLLGKGVAAPGAPVTLSISDARPNAPMATVVGLTKWSVPLLGGVLVPSPDHGFYGLHKTDASGNFLAPVTWPSGIPSGTAIYMQVWIEDPAAPMGFSATNGLEMFTP